MRFSKSVFSNVILISLILLAISTSCGTGGMDDVQSAEAFLRALQDGEFQEAAGLATDNSAGIVLFMEKMLEANETTGEELEFPIPAREEHISFTGRTEESQYVVLRFTTESREFLLHAINVQGRWLIDLPRESW